MTLISTVVSLALVITVGFAQKKCCFPDQFQAIMDQSIGQLGIFKCEKPSITTGTVEMAFDYTNKRRAYLKTLHYDNTTYHEHEIYDYKNGVYYDADVDARFCNRIALPGPMPNCIPDYAIYKGSYYIGDNKLIEDVFRFSVTEPTAAGNTTLAVSVPECIPIRSQFIGQDDGLSTLLNSVYLNFTKTISDPAKYFTPPSFCPK